MENKLRELTEKIYSEGIEKAKSDAVTILQEAQLNAEEIIKNARLEAADILRKANDQAAESRRNADSEIRMASRQALSKLKQEIVDLLNARVVDVPVKEAMNDKGFVGSLILKVAALFNNNVELALPEADKNEIEAYFTGRLYAELSKGADIKFDSNIKSGFRISPKGDNYTISFTDEDFAAYFRGFMRPRTVKLLFGEE